MLAGKQLMQTGTSADAYAPIIEVIKVDQKGSKLAHKLRVSTSPSTSSSEGGDSSSPTDTNSSIHSCYDALEDLSSTPSSSRGSLDEAPPRAPHAAATAARFESNLPIYHAACGSNLFTTFQEGWAYWLGFVQDHPPPFRLTWGLPGQITDDFQPNKLVMQLNMKWTAAKVCMAGCLLR